LNEEVTAPVLKTEINGRGDPLRSPRDTLYPQKLALASLTSGGRSVGWYSEVEILTENGSGLCFGNSGPLASQLKGTFLIKKNTY
jgi:hypothetical protein